MPQPRISSKEGMEVGEISLVERAMQEDFSRNVGSVDDMCEEWSEVGCRGSMGMAYYDVQTWKKLDLVLAEKGERRNRTGSNTPASTDMCHDTRRLQNSLGRR